MEDETSRETPLDRWIRTAKNNPVISAVLLIGIILGGLASFTDSLKSLGSLFRHDPTGTSDAKPSILQFQANPQQIHAGDTATLQWNVESADSVSIDGGIGAVPLSGSRQVAPSSSTTYTLTASGHGAGVNSTTTVQVAGGASFDSVLALEDVFAGDAGWKQPTDPVFRGSIGGGRFRMEWVENRSAQCVTRSLAIPANQDFSIQVTAQAEQPTGYAYGLCWTVAGGQASYMLYVSPGNPGPSRYQLIRSEIWQQTAQDGQPHPYGHFINLQDPADVNHQFQTPAIASGTSPNVMAIVGRGDKLQIFLNGQYIDQVSHPSEAIESVGIFIGGQLAADFRDFSVRVAH